MRNVFYRKKVKRKKVIEDVVIKIGLTNILNGSLKNIFWRCPPITAPKTAARCQIADKVVAKWPAFDRNFDSAQECVLLYKHSSSALSMPGNK